MPPLPRPPGVPISNDITGGNALVFSPSSSISSDSANQCTPITRASIGGYREEFARRSFSMRLSISQSSGAPLSLSASKSVGVQTPHRNTWKMVSVNEEEMKHRSESKKQEVRHRDSWIQPLASPATPDDAFESDQFDAEVGTNTTNNSSSAGHLGSTSIFQAASRVVQGNALRFGRVINGGGKGLMRGSSGSLDLNPLGSKEHQKAQQARSQQTSPVPQRSLSPVPLRQPSPIPPKQTNSPIPSNTFPVDDIAAEVVTQEYTDEDRNLPQNIQRSLSPPKTVGSLSPARLLPFSKDANSPTKEELPSTSPQRNRSPSPLRVISPPSDATAMHVNESVKSTSNFKNPSPLRAKILMFEAEAAKNNKGPALPIQTKSYVKPKAFPEAVADNKDSNRTPKIHMPPRDGSMLREAVRIGVAEEDVDLVEGLLDDWQHQRLVDNKDDDNVSQHIPFTEADGNVDGREYDRQETVQGGFFRNNDYSDVDVSYGYPANFNLEVSDSQIAVDDDEDVNSEENDPAAANVGRDAINTLADHGRQESSLSTVSSLSMEPLGPDSAIRGTNPNMYTPDVNNALRNRTEAAYEAHLARTKSNRWWQSPPKLTPNRAELSPRPARKPLQKQTRPMKKELPPAPVPSSNPFQSPQRNRGLTSSAKGTVKTTVETKAVAGEKLRTPSSQVQKLPAKASIQEETQNVRQRTPIANTRTGNEDAPQQRNRVTHTAPRVTEVAAANPFEFAISVDVHMSENGSGNSPSRIRATSPRRSPARGQATSIIDSQQAPHPLSSSNNREDNTSGRPPLAVGLNNAGMSKVKTPLPPATPQIRPKSPMRQAGVHDDRDKPSNPFSFAFD